MDDAYRPVAWLNIDNIGPAGSIHTSVSDMAQWVRLQLGRGVYEGQRLLDSATVKEMQTANTVIRPSAQDERMYPSHLLHIDWVALATKAQMFRRAARLRGSAPQVTLIPDASSAS